MDGTCTDGKGYDLDIEKLKEAMQKLKPKNLQEWFGYIVAGGISIVPNDFITEPVLAVPKDMYEEFKKLKEQEHE